MLDYKLCNGLLYRVRKMAVIGCRDVSLHGGELPFFAVPLQGAVQYQVGGYAPVGVGIECLLEGGVRLYVVAGFVHCIFYGGNEQGGEYLVSLLLVEGGVDKIAGRYLGKVAVRIEYLPVAVVYLYAAVGGRGVEGLYGDVYRAVRRMDAFYLQGVAL